MREIVTELPILAEPGGQTDQADTFGQGDRCRHHSIDRHGYTTKHGFNHGHHRADPAAGGRSNPG